MGGVVVRRCLRHGACAAAAAAAAERDGGHAKRGGDGTSPSPSPSPSLEGCAVAGAHSGCRHG